jgi:hypothetical protein
MTKPSKPTAKPTAKATPLSPTTPEFATILEGDWLSNAVDCSAGKPIFLGTPIDWTPAPMTMHISMDGENFYELVDSIGNVRLFNFAPGAGMPFLAPYAQYIQALKIGSGSSGHPVPQEQDASFRIEIDISTSDGTGGTQGPPGPQGDQGPIGPMGPMGPEGPEGPVGAEGPEGPEGPVGPAGPTGPAGPKGDTGATGTAGTPGVQGPPGPSAVSANAGNLAKLGTDNLILVPKNVPGVTDGSNAPAGMVGEYMSKTILAANAVAATTGVVVNVTSLSLSAGDWDVQGQIWIAPTGTRAATNVTGLAVWVSSTSATFPTVPAGSLQSFFGINIALVAAHLPVLASGKVRFSLAAPALIYLSGLVDYTGTGPIGLYGYIDARRAR